MRQLFAIIFNLKFIFNSFVRIFPQMSMPATQNQVKVLTLGCLFIFAFSSCTSKLKNSQESLQKKPLATTHHREWLPQVFKSQENTLALRIDNKPLTALRAQIEQVGQVKLLPVGDAQIVVIKPSEFAIIKEKISMQEIENLAMQMELQQSRWKPLCVGYVSQQSPPGRSYFIVVEANSLLEIRRAVYQKYLAAGGKASGFLPHRFDPHILLGSTENSLANDEKSFKDSRTCFFDLVSATGEKITHWNQ